MYIKLNKLSNYICAILPLIFIADFHELHYLLLVLYYIFLFRTSKKSNSSVNIILKGLFTIQFVRVLVMKSNDAFYTFHYASDWDVNLSITAFLIGGIMTFSIISLTNNRLVINKEDDKGSINPFFFLLILCTKLFFVADTYRRHFLLT